MLRFRASAAVNYRIVSVKVLRRLRFYVFSDKSVKNDVIIVKVMIKKC